MTDDEIIAPRVFISYSHDSPEHQDRVLALSDQLRKDGIDCNIDQYVTLASEGWPFWMERQIQEADFILMICTSTYFKRVKRSEEPGKGLGVLWEANIIYQYLYNSGVSNSKFIPILFPGSSISDIPVPCRGTTHFNPTSEAGYEELYRFLTNQPLTPKPPTGKPRKLSPRERTSENLFFRSDTDLGNSRESLTRKSDDSTNLLELKAGSDKELHPQEHAQPEEKPLGSPAKDQTSNMDASQQSNMHNIMNIWLDSIIAAQPLARNAIKLFNRQIIFLDECDRALSAMEAIRKPIQELDRLVEKHPYLFIQIRSKLINILHLIDEQVDKLTITKKTFCPSCLEASVEQRQEVEMQLKEILISIGKIQRLKKSLNKSEV